jgi:di/tricarboxylate transporter
MDRSRGFEHDRYRASHRPFERNRRAYNRFHPGGSNVGATVLLVPLVVNMAMAAGGDPRMAALVVGLATSNSFILPTHQVNALYMGPGRYRSIDFIKSGTVMSVIFLVVMIAMLYIFYGI